MEGLEISVLMKSEVETRSEDFRMESDFFKKEYVKLISKLKSKNFNYLKYYLQNTVQTGHTPSMANHSFYGTEIKFIKTDNVRDNYIKPFFNDYLSAKGNEEVKRTELKENDILTTIIGATHDIIARSCLITKEILPANINQNIALIRVDDKKINPHFLNIYLNTYYGKKYLHYLSRQMGQVNLNCREVEKLIVPTFSFEFQKLIESSIIKAYSKQTFSQQTYYQAEYILLQEIGLQNFELSKEPVNIKSFKESFAITKRLDAEYYQKKYEQIIDKIVTQKHDSLINLVDVSKSIEPGSQHYSDEEGLPFYRVADYNKFGLSHPNKVLTNSFITDNKEQIEKLKPKKGTILFSKDGSVGTAYLLREDLDGITSSAILHLQVKNTNEILPEYLTLALNSKLVQMQAERDAGGSIILHWRKEEIEQVVVPIIDFKKQEQIAELVEESFKLKVESERLLEIAKKAVEMAIEKSEVDALKFIK